jgi:pimeloyl-ACP methyl ester carboxylesterase
MYQRLLFTLSVLFISCASMAQDVMTPSDGDYIYNPAAASGSNQNPIPAGANVMQKWVHDTLQNASGFPLRNTRITFNQTNYKSYRFGITSFRIRFPNNYNPALKYPCVIFLHGAGEAADIFNSRNTSTINRENQDQLYWGAQLFENRMNSGEWNGFLLFPQLMVSAQGAGAIWNNTTIPPVNNILDTLKKYNGLDEDRVTTMGLSAGGFGCVNYARLFPQRIAGVASSSPRFIEDVIPDIPNFVEVPVWMASGGIDPLPSPSTVMRSRDSFAVKGANLYVSYYATKDHNTWETQWAQTDANNNLILTAYWNLHKAQPLVFFQNTQFCAGQPISAKMQLSSGFFAYEWERNGVTIPGATANIYTATQEGSYRARFKRTASSSFSDWTPKPVIISTKTCALGDTVFVENFEKPLIENTSVFAGPGGTQSPYIFQNYNCQNAVFANGTESFTQDATGVQGRRFMVNNTTNGCGLYYNAGDQVWRPLNGYTVTPNTNYVLNFYIGNETTNPAFNPVPALTALKASINDIALTPINVQAVLSGNVSWKKYSFIWNSGPNNNAYPSISNTTDTSTGNSFVLDEISLVKYTPPPFPGGVDPTLWSRANTVGTSDGSLVGKWNNDEVNGNSFLQNAKGREPVLKNNATDNINFNPVLAYSPLTNKFNFVPGGFSGTAVHNKAHIFIVSKFNTVSTDQDLVYEGQGTGTFAVKAFNGGIMGWTAGNGTNAIITTGGANEANKPIVWTFSKDNISNTGSGNKQDIRKNGLVVATGTGTSTFTGNNSNLNIGVSTQPSTFNGSVAEIVYLLDSTVTAASQNKIESYLAIKYGTTLGSAGTPVSYTSSNGTVFWPANALFQNDVFGIGTDSVSSLIQTISNSVNSGTGNGTGISAKGNLVVATNTSLLNNRFLMIGNDAAVLTQHVVSAAEASTIAVGSTRVGREWKVINTGGVGAVDISWDTTGLGLQSGGTIVNNYALMVDNDGDGDFKTGTLSFFNASSASGKKILFTNVTLTDNVIFTIITLKSALLPATWLGFTAEAKDGNALLNWKTSDEMNVDRYVVEHSFNGVSFATVGSVNAYNNSGENNYGFTHYTLAPGTHYYRIRRIDKDGNSGYTDTKTIRVSISTATVQVRPNPVTGSILVLAINTQQSSKTSVQVMGVDGKIILQQNVSLTNGTNLVNLNVADVPSGIYLVQVKMNDELVTKKFIRQR